MKRFTLDEARAALPQIRRELLDMQAWKREIDGLRGDLGRAVERSQGNGHVDNEGELDNKRRTAEQLVEQINSGLGRLHAMGVELKGLDEGLIDFPSERDGHAIYLCWRLEEDDIAWWHDVETGFAGRQPL